MIAFLLSGSLLMLAAGVNGQGYGRQGFGAAGGAESFGSFNPPPPFYGRGYRHRNNFDSFPNNGPNNSGFSNKGGGFDPQTNNNNNFHSSSSSSSWGNTPNTQFAQNGGFQTPNTQFGQGAQSSSTEFSSSNPRQFESPNKSPPTAEVQPGLPSSSSSSTNTQPSETSNADIDMTGAKTFGKSSSGNVAVAGGAGEPESLPTDTAPTLPQPNDGSLAVDLPQGAGSNSDQSGMQTPPIFDPNSSKLIPEPPVLG